MTHAPLEFVADPQVQHIFKTWLAALGCAKDKARLTDLRQRVFRDQWQRWNVKSLQGDHALARP